MNSETAVGGLKKATGWSMAWGILMIIYGVLAICLPLASSSIGFVVILAWLILAVGIWHLIFAFHAHGVGRRPLADSWRCFSM